jgi:predicted DNA-binding protein (MmcQ/YjbR family)
MTEAELDSICGAWPGVTRSIKWEVDLVYSVANKMFAVLCTLGMERGRLSFKVDPERFLELTDQPGIVPAPYMARAFWVSLENPTQFGKAQMQKFLHRSYELVMEKLPKKTQAKMSGETAPTPTAEKIPVQKSKTAAKAAPKKAATKKSAPKKAVAKKAVAARN